MTCGVPAINVQLADLADTIRSWIPAGVTGQELVALREQLVAHVVTELKLEPGATERFRTRVMSP
jgi:hypothetical protein